MFNRPASSAVASWAAPVVAARITYLGGSRGSSIAAASTTLLPAGQHARRTVLTAAALDEGPSSSTAASSSSGTADRAELKQQLRAAVEGIDRGIFGTTAAKREAVLSIVSRLEQLNPLPQPLQHMEKLEGNWRLLYTTITITGVKKTKLGLREFVKLGDFIQRIDTQQHTASNEVKFSVTGFGKFAGQLVINAAYTPAEAPHDGSRVDIRFLDATLTPQALEQLFRANYALLLSIFNPEGWLDVTYVDEEIRVGRDDKGNVFVVERC